MPQPLIELGGELTKPPLHIALANGFVAETYLPLLRPFMNDYRAICLPPRAFWNEGAPPAIQPMDDWRILADDLIAGLEQFNLKDVLAIGHSFGGMATLLAALKRPDLFQGIILLDPTILTPEIYQAIRQQRAAGEQDKHFLAQMASRRRNSFTSRQDAFERFRSKDLFAQWSDEVIQLYADYGTVENEDGTRRLAWSPEWEAYYYSIGYTEAWEMLPSLNALDLPMLFIGGGASDTYLPASAEKVRQIVPKISHATIAGHGHLFPQSAPQETAAVIQAWLASRG